jgi:hypothetical protein
MLIYLLLAGVLLFLPGLAITYLVELRKYRYLTSLSLSYALFVFLFKLIHVLGSDVETFTIIYLIVVSIILLLVSAKYIYLKDRKAVITNYSYYSYKKAAKYIPLYIVILLALYFHMVGPYVELPADVFRHLEFAKVANDSMQQSVQNNAPVYWGLGLNGKYWHYLYSLLANWSGLSLYEAVLPASFFNVTVFLLAVFFFSRVVFQGMQSTAWVLLMSVASVFFVFFQFGVSIFSYIRYYALAPSMLNFVLYFSVMVVVIEFFKSERWNFKYLIAAVLIFSASLFIHLQEALFSVLMICIMSFYLFAKKSTPMLIYWWSGEKKPVKFAPEKFFSNKINLTFLITQSAMVSLFLFSYLYVERSTVTQGKLIPVENILPFFKNLYILNPGFQFYQVVTAWGCMVFLMFILNIKSFKNNAYVMSAMLSPLFTVFNPFFVDLFLRYSVGDMLWRITYLLPLALVAAFVSVISIQFIYQGVIAKKVAGLFGLFLLSGLLFPLKTTYFDNQYSRLSTLKAVAKENSPAHWNDLIEYLQGIENEKIIITDPVTGYMVTSITRHRSYRYKFHRHWGYIEFNFDDYSKHPLDRYKGYLFIINKRNGGFSESGRVSKHWSENILQLEEFYSSDKLDEYVSLNPDRFKLLWEKDRVWVYLIK